MHNTNFKGLSFLELAQAWNIDLTDLKANADLTKLEESPEIVERIQKYIISNYNLSTGKLDTFIKRDIYIFLGAVEENAKNHSGMMIDVSKVNRLLSSESDTDLYVRFLVSLGSMYIKDDDNG